MNPEDPFISVFMQGFDVNRYQDNSNKRLREPDFYPALAFSFLLHALLVLFLVNCHVLFGGKVIDGKVDITPVEVEFIEIAGGVENDVKLQSVGMNVPKVSEEISNPELEQKVPAPKPKQKRKEKRKKQKQDTGKRKEEKKSGYVRKNRAEKTDRGALKPSAAGGSIVSGEAPGKSLQRGIIPAEEYRKKLFRHIAKYKYYPGSSRRRGQEGTVIVSFTIDSAGLLSFEKIVKSSGYHALDLAALETLRRAQPFPLPLGGKASFVMPVKYSLR